MTPIFKMNGSTSAVAEMGAQNAKDILGGKGSGLFELAKQGVPVPDFLVLPTSLCVDYMNGEIDMIEIGDIADEVISYFQTGEAGSIPLLSVRSGARVSMPGMMDTILNVGVMTDECLSYMGKMPGRVLDDCTRRFLHMYGSTALGIEDKLFESVIHAARTNAGVEFDHQLDDDQIGAVISDYIDIYDAAKQEVPTTLKDQLIGCIKAVMDSWQSPRAVEYRNQNAIPHNWGTAVVVQRMVFGNMNDDSGSGVLFSRDPKTGKDEVLGEYLPNAQGEDVVAGIRTPLPLSKMSEAWPTVVKQLLDTVGSLEWDVYRDMLDIEFTVESGELYFLQVRPGKRSARAAVRIALDMWSEDLITHEEVKARISRDQVRLLTQPVIDEKFKEAPVGTGIPACAGVVSGLAVFTPQKAVELKAQGIDCILVRHETSPDDIAGMFAAVGILTATGGTTSHAAVVARGMDKACVTGCTDLKIDGSKATINGKVILSGAKITIDGSTGRFWVDTDVPVSDPVGDPDLASLTTFVRGDKALSIATPDNPNGSVYALSQFVGNVPDAIEAKDLFVVYDADTFKNDPLLVVSDGCTPEHVYLNFCEWAGRQANSGAKVTFYVNGSDTAYFKPVPHVTTVTLVGGIGGMLKRPVQMDELIAAFGDIETLHELMGTDNVTSKFKLYGCERYDLLSAFK